MSFSDDDEFDSLLPLPDVDFAALDLSSYTVLPSQAAAAFRPPPPQAVKQERHRGQPAAGGDDWDLPIRVGEDGTYGLKESPVKARPPAPAAPPAAAAAAPAAVARLPPPLAPQPALRQLQQQPDAFPASQAQIPLSQGAAARQAAVRAYANADATTTAGASGARGHSVPAGRPPVGGFSQRPLAPPPFPGAPQAQQQRATSAAPTTTNGRANPFAQPFAGPSSTFSRAGSRGPQPAHSRASSRAASPAVIVSAAPGGGRQAGDDDLAALRQQNEDLLKALKEQQDAYYTAHGEASMLRRRMVEADKRSKEALEALQAQNEAAEEKRRKQEEDRRLEEEARRAKATLENHNAATFSMSRPSARPPSTANWGTQSLQRSRQRSSQQQQQQQLFGGLPSVSASQRRSGGGLFGQVAQTPAPVGRSKGGGELVLRPLGKASPKGKEREGTRPSPRSAARGRAADGGPAPPPPVPRFPTLHNSFVLGAGGASAAAAAGAAAGSANGSRRASSVKVGLGGIFRTSGSQRSPSKAPSVGADAAAGDDGGGREAKKRRVGGAAGVEEEDGDDRSGGMDGVDNGRQAADDAPSLSVLAAGGANGGPEDEEEDETTPKASQRAARSHAPATSSPVPDSDGIEGEGAWAAMDVDGEGAEAMADDDDDDEGEEYWKVAEKDILFAVLFTHQISPLSPPAHPSSSGIPPLSAPSPSTPSALSSKNPTIQAILAPLDPAGPASMSDRSEHARASARILSALGGAAPPPARLAGGGDLVTEVLKGLQAMGKLFERLNLIPLLTQTLLLIRSLILHLPRAGQVLLRLPSFTSLISAINDQHLAYAPTPSIKGKARATAALAAEDGNEAGDPTAGGREEKLRVTRAMLGVLEAVVWHAEGHADADILGNLIQKPKLVSTLLNGGAQPPDIVAQTVRIIKLLTFFESLFRPLLAFADQIVHARGRDATRIPLIDLLCKLLRDPPAQATPAETLAVSLDILDIFRTLCYKHQDDAVLLFSQQRALTPTLVICLEQCSSAIWGVDVGFEDMRRSIPPLVPLLQLLSLLTSPEESALAPTLKLADRLRSAPKADFPAAFETFMVAFGRICYAEVPDLEELAAWEDGADAGGSEWRMWEGELERAGDIARDIFDQVVEGPEGDLVYGVFVLEPDEESESLAGSTTDGGQHHPQHQHPDDEQAAPPPSSQPLGPLMPELEADSGGGPSRAGDDDSETEEDEPAPQALPALPTPGQGAASQMRRSGRTKARAVPRQEVALPRAKQPVEVVDLLDSSDED